MKVMIMYGDGFTGREYYLKVGALLYPLLEACGGGPEDEKEARERAVRIMDEKHKDIPIDALKGGVTWDGSM